MTVDKGTCFSSDGLKVSFGGCTPAEGAHLHKTILENQFAEQLAAQRAASTDAGKGFGGR